MVGGASAHHHRLCAGKRDEPRHVARCLRHAVSRDRSEIVLETGDQDEMAQLASAGCASIALRSMSPLTRQFSVSFACRRSHATWRTPTRPPSGGCREDSEDRPIPLGRQALRNGPASNPRHSKYQSNVLRHEDFLPQRLFTLLRVRSASNVPMLQWVQCSRILMRSSLDDWYCVCSHLAAAWTYAKLHS